MYISSNNDGCQFMYTSDIIITMSVSIMYTSNLVIKIGISLYIHII